MLKVLICGQDSERILRAMRFFRDREIEVSYLPLPDTEDLERHLKDGVNGILICDKSETERWIAWLRKNRCMNIVMH